MGKRTRSQRRGSSPKNRVSSHRFPAANVLPRVKDKIGEVVGLIHSPAHTAPLAKIKFEDGTEGHMAAPEGISIGQPVSFGENVELRPGNVTILGSIPEGTPDLMLSQGQETVVNSQDPAEIQQPSRAELEIK